MTIDRPRLRCMAIAIAAVLALPGCASKSNDQAGEQSAQTSQRHPESGLEVIPVTVSTAQGDHQFMAELAATGPEQAKGLMFRTQLGPDEAMIFPRKGDVASFWMKNTPLPLDIIFIGTDREILNIAAQTTPYSLDSVSAVGPTGAVLEIPGGRAAELGIEPGDTVDW